MTRGAEARAAQHWSFEAVVDKRFLVSGLAREWRRYVPRPGSDWIRCFSRYAQNHTGPTRMQPRERQSAGR
jgi:hypothetical protein